MTEARLAVGSLAVILACSLAIVLMAADRPSFLTATSHSHFMPVWMAGPLGGLLPGLTRSNTALKYLFTGCVLLMYVSYLVGLRHAAKLRLRAVLTVVVAVHLVMFLAPPLALTDIFNYVNYARMEIVHHLNPYTTIPILEPHDDPSFSLSNWHHLLSPYGPLFTLISFAIVPLGVAASFWAFKGVLGLASLATLVLILKCAQLLRRNPSEAVVFVGLNPVVLVWGLGGDHNDFIMMFFIVLAFYALLLAAKASGAKVPGVWAGLRTGARQEAGRVGLRELLRSPAGAAGGAFVVAVFIKASAAILIPVVVFALARDRRQLLRFLTGMVIAGAVLVGATLLAFGAHLPDLSTQGSVVTTVSLPNLLGLALGQGGETDLLRALLMLALAASVIACCAFSFRRGELLRATGWVTVALLVTLSWVLPWYVVWVLPMAALAGSRRLRIAALVLSAYLIIAWAPITSNVFNAIGFYPAKTPLGQKHQRMVKQLLH